MARLSEQAERKFGVSINVRVGIHRGLVYLDTDQDDVYGFAANLAARLPVWPSRARWRYRIGRSLVSHSFELAATYGGAGQGRRRPDQPSPGAR